MPDEIVINDLIHTPTTPADYASNVRYARVIVARQLGFPNVVGLPEQYAALSQADQVRLTDELSVFIVGNPRYFSASQIAIASRRVGSQSFRTPLLDDSLSAATGEFLGEIAGSITSKFTTFAIVAIIAGLAFYILPAAIARAGKTAK